MNNYADFFLGSNFALWEAAIADILQSVENQREAARKAIYLSTGILSDLADRYGVLVNAQPDPAWDVEVFREHLEEVIQAYFLKGSTEAGVKQVVGATTQIPPLLRPIGILRRWLLGFQYFPNRFFQDLDGFVTADVDEPYVITSSTNLLVFKINGVEESVTLPIGTLTAKDVIDAINAKIVGALVFPYGKRFALETLEADTGGSVEVKAESTASEVLGLETEERKNAPVPNSGTGVLPLGWSLSGSYRPEADTDPPAATDSNPTSYDGTLFGVEAKKIVGTAVSPFIGLLTGTLLRNGDFEAEFAGWDTSEGPDFFISTTQFRSGSHSLAVETRNQTVVAPDGTKTVIPVLNTIKAAPKYLPTGRSVLVDAYHQAHIPGPLYVSPASPASVFEWTVTNAVFGYADQQFSASPLDNPDATTVLLRDPGVSSFVTLGVRIGMAVHVTAGGFDFDGVVRAVSTHELLLDQWQNGPNGGPTAAYITNTTATYSSIVLTDGTANFGAIQPDTLSDYRTRDKVRIDETIRHFGQITTERQIVRDIGSHTTTTITPIGAWGSAPLPESDNPYWVYLRPPDGTQYAIYHAESEIPGFVEDEDRISANVTYEVRFYDTEGDVISTHRESVRPTPGPSYERKVFEVAAPVHTERAQLAITVGPDPQDGRTGAFVSIDDVQFKSPGGDLETELHVAAGGQIQKVSFVGASQAASGTITYNAIPANGAEITVDGVLYEFSNSTTEGRDKATIHYDYNPVGPDDFTGVPSDGDRVKIGDEVYEFSTDCNVGAGNRLVFIIAGDSSGTFQNLVTAINLMSMLVTATIDTIGHIVTIVSKQRGVGVPPISLTASAVGSVGFKGTFNQGFPAVFAADMVVYKALGGTPALTAGELTTPVFHQGFTNSNVAIPAHNVAIGKMLVVAISYFDNPNVTIFGVSDSKGNTYQLDAVSVSNNPGGGWGGNTRVIHTYIFSSKITTALVGNSTDFITTLPLPLGTNLYRTIRILSYDNVTNDPSPLTGSTRSSTSHGMGPNVNDNMAAITDGAYAPKLRVVAVSAFNNAFGPALVLTPANTPAYVGAFIDPAPVANPSPLWVYSREEAGADSTAPKTFTLSGSTLTGGNSNVIIVQSDLEGTFAAFVAALAARSQRVSVKQISPVITVTAIERGSGGNEIGFSATVPDAGYVLNPSGGFLSGGGQAHAKGRLDYTGQPTDADTIQVGSTVFEFDSNSSVVPGHVAVTIGTTADNTYTDLANAIILQDEADAVIDTSINRVSLTAIVSGVAGNSIVFSESAANVSATPNSGTLLGGVDSEYVDVDALLCSEIAAFINDPTKNPQVSGWSASCDAEGHLVLTSDTAGFSSALVVGHGSANDALGFTPDSGRVNSEKAVEPSWRIRVNSDESQVVLVSEAVEPAKKFSGTDWTARFWVKTSVFGSLLSVTESGTGTGTVTSDV